MTVEEIEQALEESELVEEVVRVEDDRLGPQTYPATYFPTDYEQDEVPQVDGFVSGTLFPEDIIDEVPEGSHTVVYFPEW